MNPRRETLTESRLRPLLAPVLPELGRTAQDRLDALLPLFAQGRARLGACLKVAFPGMPEADAMPQFRNFRTAVNTAAAAAKVGITFAVDNNKKLAPEAREVWFQLDISAQDEITAHGVAAAADTKRLGAAVQSSQAVVRSAESLANERRTVKFFVSYAHDDGKEVERFLKELNTQLGPSARYRYELWGDWRILIGADWRETIAPAIAECDFGLLLVSPCFLNSAFIREHELPALATGAKPILPVGLVPVSPRHNRLGLEERQIFFHRSSLSAEGRTFADCTTDKLRREFATELFGRLEDRLDDWFRTGGSPALTGPGAPDLPANKADELDAHSKRAVGGTCREVFIKTLGAARSLTGLEHEKQPSASAGEPSIDALDYLAAWAADPERPPFCAVLGETGIGKTTTLKQLTLRLNESHAKDASAPQAVFVDLRSLPSGAGHPPVPTLDVILASAVRANWRQSGEPTLTPAEIIDAVQTRRAVVIFDGLDEKIVHLDNRQSQQFIRELWRILPPDGGRTPGRGKLILSWRSHYFKDVWSQNALLKGEDREGVRATDYQALILLPFTEEQIRAYLTAVLGGAAAADQAMALFASVHNLRELAARPYLLSVLAENLGELERRRARGATVRGTDVYEILVRRWLGRDEGKHTFTDTDKLELMELIAGAMFAEGAREWPWARVERWLAGVLLARPEIAHRYTGVSRDVLDEDFRTATFVLRPDDARENFRFAHSSLQEYFHARHLVRALDSGTPGPWQIPLPSLDTLDFAGQLIATENTTARLATLAALLAGGGAAARVAFRHWLLAVERGYPEPAPERVDLAGTDLEKWTIRGHAADRPLALGGANLTSIHASYSRWQNVHLAGADLSGADCAIAEFQDTDLSKARLDGADFTGATLRDCAMDGLRAADAKWYDADLIRCELHGAALPADLTGEGVAAPNAGLPPVLESIIRGVHGGRVKACAWSPDGAQLASAGGDATVLIWDAASGKCLRELTGHLGGVLSCTWSPDGARLASAGNDATVRVWDPASGKCLREFAGHRDAVRTCAWSPDGTQLASAGDDRTVRVWDAASGKCLRELTGHPGWVRACAWSPDGAQLTSAGADRTVRVWDAASGKCLRELPACESGVNACAWSPDGARLALAGGDATLRILDPISGKCLRVLAGHPAVLYACAWSLDGARLASAGGDGKVRVWDPTSGKCLHELAGRWGGLQACAWSPDGARLAFAGGDATVRVWEPASGKCLRELAGRLGGLRACAWSPDGARLASVGDDRTVRVWDPTSGKRLRELSGHQGMVLACAWSPNGARLASAGNDGAVHVWDTASGECLRELSGFQGLANVVWSPDGARLASAGENLRVRIWDTASGQCLRDLAGHADWVNPWDWSPDSAWFASDGGDQTVCGQRAAASNRLRDLASFHVGFLNACAWSPDGARLTSAGNDGAVRVWDTANGQCLSEFASHPRGVNAYAWSPDGASLALSGDYKIVRIWDPASGKCRYKIAGHTGAVYSCSWSQDGKRLASAGADHMVLVWDAASGKCLREIAGHSGAVYCCAWSPDGARLASAGGDRTVRIWDADSGECLEILAQFSDGEAAALDPRANRFLWASPGAWRHLGWRMFDPAAGRVRILPAEIFGPLPG